MLASSAHPRESKIGTTGAGAIVRSRPWCGFGGGGAWWLGGCAFGGGGSSFGCVGDAGGVALSPWWWVVVVVTISLGSVKGGGVGSGVDN